MTLQTISGSINPGTVLWLILIKTSPCISQFVCTGTYFPIPAGIEHVSLAYTPTFSSTPTCNTLIFYFSQRILQVCDDISCFLVALYIFPELGFSKLTHPPSTSLALQVEPSFTGIKVTFSAVHVNLSLFFCKNVIAKFTLRLNPLITRGSKR